MAVTLEPLSEPRIPGKGWPREVAPHDLDQYGLRVTSVVIAVSSAGPDLARMRPLERRCWHVVSGLPRPVGVLEVAARVGEPPTVVAVALSELVHTRAVRKVMAPIAPESGRLRRLTDGRTSPRLFHDLWLVVSDSPEHAPAALGGLCRAQGGVMRVAADDVGADGALWLGAMADPTAYVSLVGAGGVPASSAHWPWLTHSACGAVLIVDGHDPAASGPLARELARRDVPMAVLVDTGRCSEPPTEQSVRAALEGPVGPGERPLVLRDGTRMPPVVSGRAQAPTDVDEALRDLEEYLHVRRTGQALETPSATREGEL